ncbi:MAG: riboflavin biosynthesis protein RibF [Christensenellales bacterium]
MRANIIDFLSKYDRPIAIALGFFDCIHKGHYNLVKQTINYAENHCECQSAILTFSNDPNVFFGKDKQICTFENRVSILEKAGIDNIVKAHFDARFARLSPKDFLDTLTCNFNVKAVFVGADYTFGKNAEGNVDFLSKYCREHGICLEILPFEKVGGEKLSTSSLKTFVKSGNVKELNCHLVMPYFMTGTVLHARHKGTGMGFPTVNIAPDPDRIALCDGIYATFCVVDGKKYQSMTNVGKKPTFDDQSVSVETYIFDFDGDLYGKTVTIYFVERTRDVQKFESVDALKNQLVRDEAAIRAILNDCDDTNIR